MDITLHVPVPRYVYKYCRALFPNGWRLVKSTNKESRMLYALLERSPDRYEKWRSDESLLNITITGNTIKEKGCYLSQEAVDSFVEFIRETLMDEITDFSYGIKTRIGRKVVEQVAVKQEMVNRPFRMLRLNPKDGDAFFWQQAIILDILKKYDITEDDLTFDSVKKALQRRASRKQSA